MIWPFYIRPRWSPLRSHRFLEPPSLRISIPLPSIQQKSPLGVFQVFVTFLHTIIGVFFDIDISPLVILYSEKNAYSWSSFIAQIFAIIGGVYTMAFLLDAFLYQAERRLAMKRQLGKTT